MTEKRKAILLQDIKDIGQSIIDNAEKIINDYEYQTRLEISAVFAPDEAVELEIRSYIIPENFINRQKMPIK